MTPRAMSPISPDVSPNVSSERKILRNALCLAVLSAMVVGLIWPAAAQRYVGRNSTPSVTVDYSVLDELGRAPNIPQLMLQNPTGSAYRNNPYRGRPRFPVISRTTEQDQTGRIILKPPTAERRPGSRKPARKAKRRANPTATNQAVRRTPLKSPAPVARRPQALAPPPPPPSAVTAPTAIVQPPPPNIVQPARRKAATPPAATAVPPPPRAPAPPPLPPVAAVPKPKPIARTAAPPPPAPPKATEPAPATRKVVTGQSNGSGPATKTTPPRTQTKQVASLPKSTAALRSGSLRRIEFPPGSAKLSNQASLGLQNIAAALSGNPALRIQLLAYAGQSSDSASQARRLSLSRALAARSKLIEQGVRSTRIDVRALGNKSAGGPADRIDIIVTKR